MFEPPRCPNSSCPAHRIQRIGGRKFYVRRGYYKPKCRSHRVPRFVCRLCGRGFSRQTFRPDYCDNKPHKNARLLKLLSRGVSLRQSAGILKLSNRCTQLKARKLFRVHRSQAEPAGYAPGTTFTLAEVDGGPPRARKLAGHPTDLSRAAEGGASEHA